MPYVGPAEAPNCFALDVDALRRELGPPPWRKPLVGSPNTRWVIIGLPPGYMTIPHRHPRAEETFYILEGEAVFRFGGEDHDRRVGPGTLLLAPRNVMHTIGVPGRESMIFICSVTPNEDAPDETIEDPTAPGVTL
jgi:quercetin dioxygenase-like cupin family protein